MRRPTPALVAGLALCAVLLVLCLTLNGYRVAPYSSGLQDSHAENVHLKFIGEKDTRKEYAKPPTLKHTLQQVIPLWPREPGSRLNNASLGGRVKLEAFLELFCPQSAEAWPVLRHLLALYGPANLDLVIHQFPLPYHQWSYIATLGFYHIATRAPGKEFLYMERIFAQQSKYIAMAESTQSRVLSMLADDAGLVTDMSSKTFMATIEEAEDEARSAWKYACHRGVAGVPWFFVNGVDLSIRSGENLSLGDWRSVIDPLLV